MELRRIEYTTKSKINMKAIKGFASDSMKKRFEDVGKFKPLILRILIDNTHEVHIEDFDIITLENIRRVAGYQPSGFLTNDVNQEEGVIE